MKILVVNNGTIFLERFRILLKDYNFTIIDSQNLNIKKISRKDFDKIILTGGSRFSVRNHLSKYKKEIDLVRGAEVPLLGICLGFEIICAAYGEKLKRKIFREKRIKIIKIPPKSRNYKIFKNLKSFWVYENHLWKVKNTRFLIPLIRSEGQIEMVKHPSKIIYGVQFHPEYFKTKKANKIIKNFLRI